MNNLTVYAVISKTYFFSLFLYRILLNSKKLERGLEATRGLLKFLFLKENWGESEKKKSEAHLPEVPPGWC
jgi:hypothetical protein